MRILISDYREQMEADYGMTIDAVREVLPDAHIVVEAYDTPEFYRELSGADGLITAFVDVDETFLDKAPHLACISQSAVGYSNLDMDELEKRNIGVCHIEEYCTREVSEHAIALMMALNHNLSRYEVDIRERRNWLYQDAPAHRTLDHRTLVVFGLGRIGRQTAAMAKGLGMKVLAVDPYVSTEQMAELGIVKVDRDEALRRGDIIINHMALTRDNYHYFDRETFAMMKRDSHFINVGRGGCVDEQALIWALGEQQIEGAALDVLEAENPDLNNCPFVGRDDVILTPHSAFYSANSIEKLHRISGHNLAYYLAGRYGEIDGLVYKPESVDERKENIYA